MSSHFYHPATGALIDGDLRDARKLGGLPSPTTVLSMLSSFGLHEYFKRQMFEATATTPRQAGWSDDQYYEAVVKHADEHGKIAREKGGAFHDMIQQFHLSVLGRATPPTVPPELTQQYDAYLRWYETNVEQTLGVEEVVFGDGYGGRYDHRCLLKDGRYAMVDGKTQGKKAGRDFNKYLSWALQLGAYAGACQEQVDIMLSVIVSSNEPVILEAHVWPKPVEHYHSLFMGLLAIWCEEKRYWPS